jgi:hypothetical protein
MQQKDIIAPPENSLEDSNPASDDKEKGGSAFSQKKITNITSIFT